MAKHNMVNIRHTLVATFFSLLVGCSSSKPPAPPQNLDTLDQVQGLQADKTLTKAKGMTEIREQAIKEAALSTGAQAGLAYRAKQINAMLDQKASYLDYTFNFNQLLMDHNVLPPVLVEGDNSLNLDNDTTIRIADRTYQIISQARFVTTPPTWRDYLVSTYTKPEAPDNSLLPENAKERDAWKNFSEQGWKQGIQQAEDMYDQNLSRLKRDYAGMIRYKFLLAQHMVSAPYVSRTDMGITGGGSDMRVNDQILRITELPSLQANSKTWKPIISQQPTPPTSP